MDSNIFNQLEILNVVSKDFLKTTMFNNNLPFAQNERIRLLASILEIALIHHSKGHSLDDMIKDLREVFGQELDQVTQFEINQWGLNILKNAM